MSFVIRAMGGVAILIRVVKQNGYESCRPFCQSERSVKNVIKENARGMQGDLISRQTAIDALRTCYDTETITMDNGDEYINYGDAVGEIERLPPVQPKRGKWIKISPANIYECSECGKSVMTNDICAYDFCHGCGADMREDCKKE